LKFRSGAEATRKGLSLPSFHNLRNQFTASLGRRSIAHSSQPELCRNYGSEGVLCNNDEALFLSQRRELPNKRFRFCLLFFGGVGEHDFSTAPRRDRLSQSARSAPSLLSNTPQKPLKDSCNSSTLFGPALFCMQMSCMTQRLIAAHVNSPWWHGLMSVA
jgi:hypothetical protein